ncbi:UNVERIFIED_CONTAM: Glycosyltransferase BC10 [Sesamum angustifolium]|uniref:Glycosyltransferase BC10 n=1 Tax=Sesamum angustifolium TaxID=2727405 RepID=A0AAW2RNG0_9LAMI
MRRRSNSQKFHHRWKRKLLAALLLGFCFATFVLMESEYSRIKMLSLISPPLIRKPKIAFLFIARNRIPLDMVWDAFFQGADKDRFSVYVHSRPGFLLTTTTTRSTYFLNRQINDSVQWVVLTRKHAEIVVQDDTPADGSKEHNCIPDEHYVQTLLAQKGLEGEITRRSLTHTSWDVSSSRDPERRGWHPVTYKLADATPKLIQSIKDIVNIYYETEYRREWCTSKGKPSRCFLFARKFTRPAALRLLNTSALGISAKQQMEELIEDQLGGNFYE